MLRSCDHVCRQGTFCDHFVSTMDMNNLQVDLIWCKCKGPCKYGFTSDIFVCASHFKFVLVGHLFLLVRSVTLTLSWITFSFEIKNQYITPLGFVVNIVGEVCFFSLYYTFLWKYMASVDLPQLVHTGRQLLRTLNQNLIINIILEVCGFRSKHIWHQTQAIVQDTEILSDTKVPWRPLVSV